MYNNDIRELCGISGSFALPTGAPTFTDSGFIYENDDIRIVSNETRHASGVISRCDTVRNISEGTVTLTSALSRFSFDNGEWEVFTQYSEWCNESQGKWAPLVTEIAASNYDTRACSGATPFIAIWNKQTGRGYAFHILADSMWQARVYREFRQSVGRRTVVELGIRERGFSRKLDTGDTLPLAEILYYEFRSKLDFDAYKLHRYLNERYPAREIPVMYNTWMSHEDRFTRAILDEQLVLAKRIGAEYFVVDAGWFGPPERWWRSVGDWVESEESGLAMGMKEFSDSVRAAGLKFGLWFEMERAGLNSHSVNEHPEHYIFEGDHGFIDFASPAACDFLFEKICAAVDKYGIEYIKLDNNASITYDKRNASFTDYFCGKRRFIERLRKKYPEAYVECCSSGGTDMAIATLDRGYDSFWMSDDHSLYNQMRFYKDTMIRMPSRALEKWITIRSVEDFRELPGNEKILVSGDMSWIHIEAINRSWLGGVSFGGPVGISCDLTKLSEKTLDQLADIIEKHKSGLNFLKNCECRILSDTETLTALEWSDPELSTVRVTAFTGIHNQTAITLYPVVSESATYIDCAGNRLSGSDILRRGITLSLGGRFESYTITLKAEQ